MKLGTLRNGARDGRLVVVSHDITRCSDARHIAPTLQAALDNWDRVAPHLDLIARGVETGGQPTERFHEREALSPLPRAYRWLLGGAGADAPREASSDGFLDPRGPLHPDEGGHRFGAAVILGDVPRGADAATAAAAIRLVLLADVTESGGATFSPVAVTPDELGDRLRDGRFTGGLGIARDGLAQSGSDTALDFAAAIVAATRDRALAAGSLLGLVADQTVSGHRLRAELRDGSGHSIFGAIERETEREAVLA